MLNDLKNLLALEPFRPFRIVLTSGGAYAVNSPYQVAVGESQLTYYQPKSDDWAVLRLNQIAAFEVGNAASSNGPRSKPRRK
jgi:hypothetical protein